MKRLFLITLVTLAILGSCKTTVKTTEIEVRIDTIYRDRVVHDTVKEIVRVTHIPPTMNETRFNPCDSVGKVKPTNFKIKSGIVTVYVKDTLGELKFTVMTDSIKNVYQNLYRSHYEKELEKRISELKKTSTSKKVVYRWSKMTYVFLIIAIVLAIILLSKFRRLIPTIF